jgi:hypothetical protein
VTALAEKAPARPAAPVPGDRARLAGRLGPVLIAVSLAAWLVALPGLPHAPISQYGLLATASPLFVTAFAVDVIAFGLCVRAGRFAGAAASLVLLAVEQRLPTAVSTSVPLYSWTYKHLGVVDYIRDHGQLAHGVDVYQGWPGLFAFTAWFSDLTGVPATTVAHWFTPVVHGVLLFLIYALGRAWRLEPLAALVASFLFEALNWVGQDYYSPQATALVFSAGFLIVLGLSRDRGAAVPAGLVIFAALVVTHQLTPYWLMLTCLVLTGLRRLRPRWLVFAMIGIAGTFLAFNYDSVAHFSLLSLHPVANAESNVPTIGAPGQQLTSAIVRGLSVLMWLAAAGAVVVHLRRRARMIEPAVLAFSSFLLLGGQSYGGEAIFRVFLYSLFGCALVTAPVLTRLVRGRWFGATPAFALLIVAVVASAQGFFGGWFANRMSVGQVREAQRLLDTVPIPGYITVAAPVWPERPTGRYVEFAQSTNPGDQSFDYPMIYEAKLVGNDFDTAQSYDKLIHTASGRTAPTYLIITNQMKIYDWYFGILPRHALDHLETRLRKDHRWTVYKSTSQYVIFKSTPSLIGAK